MEKVRKEYIDSSELLKIIGNMNIGVTFYS
jgi:hypothetical protein